MTLFYNLGLTNIAITCHWIDDDWNLHEALLDFKHVPGSHTERNLGDHVFNVIKEFGIQNKLFCITTDNVSNNSKMMKRISKLLKNDFKINWDPKKHHVACINHVINLAIQDFLKSLKGLSSDSEELEADELNPRSSAEPEVVVNEEDSEDDEMVIDEELEEEEPDEDISGDSFQMILKKIRILAKVLTSCHEIFDHD